MRLVPGVLKRAFLRVVRFTIRHPVDQLSHPLHLELADLEGKQAELEQRQRGTQAAMAGVEVAAHDLLERGLTSEASIRELSRAVSELRNELAANRSELLMQRARLELVLREARRALPEPIGDEGLGTLTRELETVLGEQYEDFENTFRGPRDVVLERQRVYLDDVLSLQGQSLPVLDVGCGRGEWLELLRDHEIAAYGVDTNASFVEANRERRLDARLEDAFAHVEGLPESSVAAITAFHFVEHLDVEHLVRFVDDALRVIRPDGLLILETPNPTNLAVGASTFHIDPTHTKPVHPQWLEFLLTARGFVGVELRYLHPAQELQVTVPADGTAGDALRSFVEQANAVLFGPRDYAALARKPAPVAR
jgi:SAM-dependent methyltransferase